MDDFDGSKGFDRSTAEASPVRLAEPSLADAMNAIAADKSLSDSKRKHWLTSMRRIAEGIGRPPESLPARLSSLRHPVSRLNATAMGIGPKSLANHKSNLRAAVQYFMKETGAPRRGTPLTPAWRDLLGAITAIKPRRLLSGIARYTSAQGIRPDQMSLELVDDYFRHREATSFLEVGVARKRELIRAWNWCSETIPYWPKQIIPPPDLAPATQGPEWSSFPDRLQRGVASYLASLTGPHRSANGKRRRPCRSSTVQTRRRELEAFARRAVAIGIPIDSLTSLAVLLSPAVCRPVLEDYAGPDNMKARSYTIDLAWKLHSIAKAIDGVSEETVSELKEMCEVLEEQRGSDLTEKNRKVIRAVLASDIWHQVCNIPAALMREAEGLLNRSPQKAATRAGLAILILILTRAPVRIGNLMHIRLGHNLIRPGGRQSAYVLIFPDHDVKNRVDLTFPLSDETSALIDRYIDLFRPFLGSAHRSDWLFPGTGKARNSAHASVSIANFLEKTIGMRITAHQFRHAAAALILRSRPGDYEFVRRILGHLNLSTTTNFYTGLEGFSAGQHFGKLVEERLNRSWDNEE